MTNQDRIDAQNAATALIERCTANKADLEKAREAAAMLAGALLELICCESNTISAAKKVRETPRAEQIRDLESSKRHREAYAAKRVRVARARVNAAMAHIADVIAAPTPPAPAPVTANKE